MDNVKCLTAVLIINKTSVKATEDTIETLNERRNSKYSSSHYCGLAISLVYI